MNPLVVIPTYWSRHRKRGVVGAETRYDHTSPVGTQGGLVRCLDSLSRAKDVGRIVLLPVSSDDGAEELAATWVRTVTASFPELDILTMGPEQVRVIHDRLSELGLEGCIPGISLDGYGAVHNVGLAIAAILGHDAVIFIDDDEVVEDDDFIDRACYGLGGQTRRGIPVFVKTGIFYDRAGSCLAPTKRHWYDCRWPRNRLFNEYVRQALGGARLSRANTLYGGLAALHYEAFRRVSFDPYIARGEDLDYLINLRMYGLESWLDDEWSIRHLPPETLSPADRFAKDAYRWIYEQRKVEYGRSQIDLLQVRPHDLDPYPGPFLEPTVAKRIRTTALLRWIALQGKGYLRVAFGARRDAQRYAAQHCSSYFSFQYHWPEVIADLERDTVLERKILTSESAARVKLSEQLYEKARYEEAKNILEPLQQPRTYRTTIPKTVAVLNVDGDLTDSFQGLRADSLGGVINDDDGDLGDDDQDGYEGSDGDWEDDEQAYLTSREDLAEERDAAGEDISNDPRATWR